jgi:hypothetical protein
MTDLDELERLAKAATPGPWTRSSGTVNYRVYGGDRSMVSTCQQVGRHSRKRMEVAEAEGRANAAYIAACSPEVVAALVRCVQTADDVDRSISGEPEMEAWRLYGHARSQLDAALGETGRG